MNNLVMTTTMQIVSNAVYSGEYNSSHIMNIIDNYCFINFYEARANINWLSEMIYFCESASIEEIDINKYKNICKILNCNYNFQAEIL